MKLRAIVRSTALVTAIRGVDFGLSFLVSILLAGRFGAGAQLDAFFLARRVTVGIADQVRKLVNQVVMPSVVRGIDGGAPLSIRHLPRRTYLFIAALVAVTLIGTVIPSALVSLFAPGFKGERHDLTATMMAIMMPLLPMAVVGATLIAVLQASHRYGLSEGTNLFQRAILVVVLAVAVPPLGIIAGAWTMLIAGVVGLAILFIGAWSIIRPRAVRTPIPGDQDAGATATDGDSVANVAAAVGGGFAAAIAFNVCSQATALLDFAVGSTVPAGGVAALEYGSRLASLVPGIVMSSVYTVLQPELIRAMQHPDSEKTAAGLARYQRITVFAQLPVSIGMMLGAELMITILFGRGAFGESSIALSSATTAGYAAAGLFLAPVSSIIAAIYADPRAPCLRDTLIISVGFVLFRCAALAVAAPSFGAAGIAWAAAISTAATAVLAQLVAIRRFRAFDMRAQLRDLALSLLCGGAATLAGYAWLAVVPDPQSTVMRLAVLMSLGGIVLATFVCVATLLHVPELTRARRLLADITARKLSRRAV